MPITAWFRDYGSTVHGKSIQRLWVSEDDIFFVGRLDNFVKWYNSHPADYVATEFNARGARTLAEREKQTDDHWTWSIRSWLVPISYWSQKREHVEMFSRRFLDFVYDLLRLGIYAYGEDMELTVCRGLRWCTARDLQEDGFVKDIPSSYNWDTRFSEPQIKQMMIATGMMHYNTHRQQQQQQHQHQRQGVRRALGNEGNTRDEHAANRSGAQVELGLKLHSSSLSSSSSPSPSNETAIVYSQFKNRWLHGLKWMKDEGSTFTFKLER